MKETTARTVRTARTTSRRARHRATVLLTVLTNVAVISLGAGTAHAVAPATDVPAGTSPAGASPAGTSSIGSGELLDKPRHGTDALNRLGSSVAEAARINGTDVTALRKLLESDGSAWLDKVGKVHYVEPPSGAQSAPANGSTGGAIAAYGDTFLLHSKAGSPRTIYLDFNGHTVSATAWNASYTGGAAFVADPFDIDGVPASFSTAEQTVVQQVWQRVAEDYAAFDVDITTEEPPAAALTRTDAADQAFGTRLLVTNTSTIASSCGCGGIAYLSVFGAASNHDYFQPAFVFQRGVGTSSKAIAEAASHEVGHNLGLHHDGTTTVGYYSGQGAWAPIMGVGYYKAITQWSKGEYAGANNGEDDLAVMAANGIAIKADDVGDSRAAATPLGAGPALSAKGLISTRADHDVFSFTTAGGVANLAVDPSPLSPDLDVRATLSNAAGVVLATADPASGASSGDTATGLSATFALTLAAGTYYLDIDGVGVGDPRSTGYSDYASTGQYRVSGTINAVPNVAPVAVAVASTLSGAAPLAVTFSGTGSSDRDGTIAAYAWNFGDGTSAATATAAHTYNAAGSYVATLTVTDNLGARTTSAPLTITVTPALVPVRVQAIAMAVFRSGGKTSAQAAVKITDTAGRPIAGATLSGAWSGATVAKVSGVTDANGMVTFSSVQVAGAKPSFTFTVSAVTKTGSLYNPTKNVLSSATVS